MKLIDKIIAYCKKVEKAERPKQSDKEEYSHGKYAVASSVLKLVELNQPEPPTLHPMSELPKLNSSGVCLTHESLNNTFAWVNMTFESPKRYLIGFPDYDNCMSIFEAGKGEYKSESYTALGWLPLPNPNEIKPC